MPSWLADPFVRLRFARMLQSKEALRAVPVLALIGAMQLVPLFQWVDSLAVAGFIGLIGLIAVIPSIANVFVLMDRDGRLDQLRLSGRKPSRILSSWTVAFVGGPIVLSLVLYGSWRIRVGLSVELLIATIVLVGGSVALSILALALPRTNRRLDGRQFALGIGFLLLVTTGVVVQDQSPVDVLTRTKFRNPFPLSVSAISVILLAGQGVIVALVWRKALAAVARPASLHVPAATRLWAFRGLRQHPALYRALVSTAVPAAVVSIVTMTVIAGLTLAATIGAWSPNPDLQGIIRSGFPLAAGALAISLAARDDRDRGRLDVLRLGPLTGLRAIASLSAAHWLLFVMAMALAHGAALVAWGASPREFALAIVVLCIVAPVPLIEGWDRVAPLGYTLPAAAVCGILISDPNAAVLDGAFWKSSGTLRTALLCWIPWVCAKGMWRQPDRPPLTGWTGILAMASLTVAAMWPGGAPIWVGDKPPDGFEFASVVLLLSTGFFVNAHSAEVTSTSRLVATILIAGAAVSLVGGRPARDAVLAVLTPAVAWWVGVRLHTWLGHRHFRDPSGWTTSASAAARVSVALVVIFGSRILADYRWPGDARARTATFALLLLAVAVLAELTYQFHRRVRPLWALGHP